MHRLGQFTIRNGARTFWIDKQDVKDDQFCAILFKSMNQTSVQRTVKIRGTLFEIAIGFLVQINDNDVPVRNFGPSLKQEVIAPITKPFAEVRIKQNRSQDH